MTAINLPNNWQPREYQRAVWEYLERGGRHAEYIWHRRSGKDEVGLHRTAVAAFERVGTYWYMLPMAEQARKAIWTAINPHTGKRRVDEAFPEVLRRKTLDNSMFIEFINGSTWQVVGSDNFNSLVGSPPVGIVYSEWPISNPSAKAYLRPILAENGGWQIFNGTPRGKNHAYRTLGTARDNPKAFTQILTARETGIFSTQQLDELRKEYIGDFGETLGTALFEQEYMCSFETPIMGAVFGRELRDAAKRIMRVPYDPTKDVITIWDLGRADKTAVWFVQKGPFEWRCIDYLDGVGKHIGEYIPLLTAKNYRYGDTWLPHDAFSELLASKRTVAQQLIDAGFKVRRVPKTSVDTRIEAARLLFPMVYFDEEKTELGRDALLNYQYDVNEETKEFSKEPLHNWASHASDAFCYLGVVSQEPRPAAKAADKPRIILPSNKNYGGGWMS